MVHRFSWPTFYASEQLGRPSRKGVTAAIEAHLAVLNGDPSRKAIAEALREEGRKFGGQERRFIALVVRELSRHQRLLDFASRLIGFAPSSFMLKEDQALVRYALWRRLFCGEGWERIGPEVKLPGPVRPRSIKDALLEQIVRAPLPDAPEQPDGLTASAIRHSFPAWLAERLAREVPEGEVDALLAALNEDLPIVLRVRPGMTPDEALSRLAEQEVLADAVDGAPGTLVVRGSGHRVFDTDLLRKGRLQVQDVGSQLIVALAAAPVGGTAVDLCAGAGGKTIGLADAVGPKGRVAAGDASKRRLQDARERVRDLHLKQVSFPFPLQPGAADVVLIDAPCSGVGSLAREPEQKWKRTAKDVTGFAVVQRKLLEESAAALKVGARLVYATCSLLREENEAIVEAFLAAHPEFAVEDAAGFVDPRFCAGPWLRVYPHRHPGGGFFGARLVKRGTGSAG